MLKWSHVAMLSGLLFLGCNSEDTKINTDTFNTNLMAEPTTLNPLTSTDGYASSVQAYIMESLVTRDVDTYEFKPALATSWTISKDKKVFEFKLRQGVKWQDGTPFTAEDVKFSFDALFDPKYNTAHMRPYYEGIEKVEIVDPQTIRFYAKDNYYKNFDSASGIEVLPKHIYENPSDMKKLNKILIGTGPYKLEKYEKGKRIILSRSSDWWGNEEAAKTGEHNFKKISFRFVGEKTVALEMLKKGTIDFKGLDPEEYVSKTSDKIWETDLKKLKVENKSPKGYNFYGWNFKSKIFQDKRVRRALNHLVNRSLMLDKFEFNLSEYATGPLYVQSDYASKKVKPIMYDPKEALRLLNEAGWSDTDGDLVLDKVIDGVKTKFSFTVLDPYDGFMKYNTIFKEDAKKIGVDVEIKVLEWNSFVKLLDEKKFDAIRMAWGGGSVDWEPKQIWHSSSIAQGSNFISYHNPEVDKLIDEARLIFDTQTRIKKLQKVYEIIADDAPYAFFFNSRYAMYAHRNRIWKPKETFTYGVGQSFWKIVE
ncbi:MAG: peptide ABC transporter substrate-binding protein [Bacteriovoracaceae bacterium]|nr:peptide ABC transporter substrate-binding protein [Bacteriovoracaceae bacterium]